MGSAPNRLMKNDYEDFNLRKGYDMFCSNESAESIISRLDAVAESVQAKGHIKEALDIDVISNTLEKLAGKIPAGSERPAPVFSDRDPKVNDGKDHYPIPDKSHAISALQRLSQFKDSKPTWWDGSLEELKSKVISAVRSKFPGIKIEEEKYK